MIRFTALISCSDSGGKAKADKDEADSVVIEIEINQLQIVYKAFPHIHFKKREKTNKLVINVISFK